VTPPPVHPLGDGPPPDRPCCDALLRVLNLALWFALNCADDLRAVAPPPSSSCGEGEAQPETLPQPTAEGR
jgi:hypothetical protein